MVFRCFPCALGPCRRSSRQFNKGLRQKTKSIMLRGHPCRTPHWMGMGVDVCSLSCMTYVVFLYIIRMHSVNSASKPYLRRTVRKYVCDIRSKACLKYRDTTHNGRRVVSAQAIASGTVATASKIVFPGTPQYWIAWSSSARMGRTRAATSLANIL